ncbi:MAG TPA: MFS transporter [Dehalococcoidia bacterium]|jgi:MFS family permease|nr:MFS transporter [Dehalococcoidia bacterium]
MLATAPIRNNRQFRLFWLSSIVFFSGFWAQLVVLAWLAFEITGSEFAVAAFAAARFAPLLFGPVGGLVADAANRPRLLMLTNLVALAIGAITALLATLDVIAYWHVLVSGFLIGMTQAPLQPTRFTLLMDIVPRDEFSSANALNMAAMMGSRIAAPAAAGALIATSGGDIALWFSAVWYVPAAYLIWRVTEPRGRDFRSASAGVLTDLADGFRLALSSRALGAVLLVSIAANLFAWPVVQGFMPVFADEVLSVGAAGLGVLVAAHGAGALVGALLIASLGDFPRKGQLFLLSTGIFGLLLIPFALTESMPLAVALMVTSGLASAGFGVMQSTLTLLLAPEEARGRVTGMLMLSIGVLPLSMLGQGAIAGAVGVVATTVAAGIMLAISVVVLVAAIPELLRAR